MVRPSTPGESLTLLSNVAKEHEQTNVKDPRRLQQSKGEAGRARADGHKGIPQGEDQENDGSNAGWRFSFLLPHP